MPGPPQSPSLYDAYVQPALSGLRRAAGAIGIVAPPSDPGALDGLRRAQQSRLQQAYDSVSRDMPGLQPVSVGLGGGMAPQRNAETSNWSGNVTFNQDNVDALSDPELQEVMTHELTHARQTQGTPLLQKIYNQIAGPGDDVPTEAKGGALDRGYYWRPNELEAFQAQRDRMTKSGRSLQTDPMTGQYDTYLPPEKGGGR